MDDIRCAVLLASEADPAYATTDIAKIIGPALGLTAFDARHAVRRNMGFAARHLEQGKAKDLARSLNEAGLRSLVLPEAEVVPQPRPIRLTRLRLHSDSFSGLVSYRWLEDLPWSELLTVHGYAFAYELEALPDGERRRSKGVSVDSIEACSEHARNLQWNISSYQDRAQGFRIQLCIDLLTREHLLRIRHDAFHFDVLDERRPNSIDSFAALLLELTRRAEELRGDDSPPLPMRTDFMTRPASELKLFLFEKHEERDNANLWLRQRHLWKALWRPRDEPAKAPETDAISESEPTSEAPPS